MPSSNHINRRDLLRTGLIGTVAAVSAPMLNLGNFRVSAVSTDTFSKQTVDLVQESLVIDMLAPLSVSQQNLQKWVFAEDGFTKQDFNAFKRSGVNVLHHAVGLGGAEAHREALEYVGLLNSFIVNHPNYFVRIDSPFDLAQVRESGKIGVIIGIQNAEHFRSPGDITVFHGLGERVAQLTYNSRNRIGNGATERVDGGISDFGVSIIESMNRAGMLVDVSHCGDKTTLEAFEISKKPVAITHSNCRALNNHPRLKTDEAIKAMAKSGGVMGITAVRNFVRDREPTTVDHVAEHIDHVARLVGVEHVGIGTDVDLGGYDNLPTEEYEQLKALYKSSYAFRDKIDVDNMGMGEKYYRLVDALFRRGYSTENIKDILGRNFLRLLSSVW